MNQSNYNNPFGHGQQPEQGFPAQDGHYVRPGGRAYADAYGDQPGLLSKLSSPAFMTVGVLAFATLLGFMVFSYLTASPSDTDIEPLPVIEPDRITYRMQPEDPEGMDVPFERSAAFDVLREPDQRREREEFSQNQEPFPDQTALAEPQAPPALRDITARQDATLLQGPEDDTAQSQPNQTFQQIAEGRAEKEPPSEKPQRLHSAGSSPDTIAYVRSVLENEPKAQESQPEPETIQSAPDAETVQNIEPAAGAAAPALRTIEPGTHYLQLSSVTSREGAQREWKRLQKEFDDYLTGLDHRVQEANLGARGTFYRIQVGPMSKQSADALCADIKSQKSTGCLVIK